MDDSFESDCFESDDAFADLEQAIFSARNFVVPSDDLRPNVMEEAKENSLQRLGFRRLGILVMACLLVWLIAIPTARALSVMRSQMSAPSTKQVEQVAEELSTQNRYGPNWGLVDAFEKTPLRASSVRLQVIDD